jgi:DNA polymerase-3 subunit delta'
MGLGTSARITDVDWGLIGNGWAVDLLRRQLARSTTHHAYLFTGPGGVGRARLALAFAQAILCENPPQPGDWCGACRACRQVPERKYPDLHWIETLEEKQGITIDQVRDLQRQLSLSSLAGGGRVAVLLEVEKASEGAANALLKTLEEPARRVCLVLTASDADEVPPTIASRCELLALRLVPQAEIASALEARGQGPAAAREVAGMANGRPGLALQMISDPALRRRRLAHAAELQETMDLGLAGRFALADRWKEDEHLEERLMVWLTLLGDDVRAAIEEAGGEGSMTGTLPQKAIHARQALDAVLRTLEALRRNANVRLALETLMLDLPTL